MTEKRTVEEISKDLERLFAANDRRTIKFYQEVDKAADEYDRLMKELDEAL